LKDYITKEQKHVVPRIEEVNDKYDNTLRYFHTSDIKDAEEVMSQINNFLKKEEKSELIPLDLSKQFNAPKGQFEVWLNPDKSG
jgi:hypothetical protein